MAKSAVAAAQRPVVISYPWDRKFYTGMAIAMLLTVLVGFAPTYYLTPVMGGPSFVPLTHLHAALFSSWVVLFMVQTSLVAARKVAAHRRLGIAGAILALSMVVIGASTAIAAAARGGSISAPQDIPPRVFLVVPLFDVAVFGTLVGSALYLRRNKEAHKRLMLVAYSAILTAAIARWPLIQPMGVLAFFAITDLFIVAGAVYDYRTRGRVHPAYIYGGLLLVISQPLRLFVGGTEVWMRFATWLTS